jgi:hypothetical protein
MMKFNSRRLLRSTLLVASTAMISIGSLGSFNSPANASSNCQCTAYVSARFGNFPYPAHAADWGSSVLPRAGFSKISGPQAGAIVVMGRSFPGSDRNYGHVGIVEQVLNERNGVFIRVRGANQAGGSNFSEAGCKNVNVIRFGTSVSGRSDISFWVKNSTVTPPAPDNNPIRQVNFTVTTNRTYATNVRSGPSLNDRVLRQLATNTTVRMDGWRYGSTVNDMWTGQPDSRWYRIAGTNEWVSSAVVAGNAPDSKPMP